MKDFTLKIYKELLLSIGSGDFTFLGYINNKNQNVILRHDVDRPPKNVIQMAKLENELGIKATYYFRVKPKLFDVNIISQVKKLKHEIGYHYEVLDKTKGDFSVAIEIFKREWELFRKWDAKTICMHGNPLSNFDNKKLWEKYEFKKYGVLGEAYNSVDFNEIEYITDTGRNLNNEKFSIKDKSTKELIALKGTRNLIDLIGQKKN